VIRRKKKPQEQIDQEKEESQKMKDFFLSIWFKKPHNSELSGAWLGYEFKTIFFHHILKSRKYSEAKYDEENIILLTFEEHQQAEMNEDRYEEINKRRDNLKEKYGIK